MSYQEILDEHVVDIHKVVADFRDAFLKEVRLHLPKHMASTNTFPLNHLAQHSQLEPWAPKRQGRRF